MTRINRRALKEVSRRTGLKVSTVADLLRAGWSYKEVINQVRVWEGPEAQLHI